jgi:hypothetical protein
MTRLEELERELALVQSQLRDLTQKHAVLSEQITRLQKGTPSEVVCAALQVAAGIPQDRQEREG